MKKQIKLMVSLSIVSLVCGCQELNSDVDQLNKSSNLTEKSNSANASSLVASQPPISNRWRVIDNQAMAWLSHNEISWNANGKLRGVNWYEFWSQQIHYHTPLAKNAYNYCHVNGWSTQQVGTNCQTYWQAYSMTKSEKSRAFGQRLEDSE